MRPARIISALLILCFTVVIATGCEREGSAEKAGKKVDQAFDSVKDKFKEATK